MIAHTCHTPYCWMLSCAVCASCIACQAPQTRLVDDPNAPADLRAAVELLGATPPEGADYAAWLDGAETEIAARLNLQRGVR